MGSKHNTPKEGKRGRRVSYRERVCVFKKKRVDLEVHIPAADVVRWQAVHVGRILVKVGRVHCTADLRDDGRRERSIAQPLPVESIKPPGEFQK